MNPVEAVALLYRASRSERCVAGTLTVHEVPEVRIRLVRRSLDQAADQAFGPGRSRLNRLFGDTVDLDGVDWSDRSTPFRTVPGVRHELSGLQELLRPDWLLSGFELSVPADQPDGPGVRLTAVPRPAASASGPGSDGKSQLSRIELVLDRSSGILLGSTEFYEGELCSRAEITGLVLDPPPEQPPGGHRDEREDEASDAGADSEPDAGADREPGSHGNSFGDLADQVPAPVRLIARGVGAVIGEAVRTGARISPPPEPDDDAEPWFEPSPEPAVLDRADPDPADFCWLLHRSGRGTPRFTAELHSWLDAGALQAAFRDLRVSEPVLGGLFGPEPFWTAVGEVTPDRSHQVHRLAFADLLHYRLDTVLDNRGKRPLTVSCDGATGYRRFPDRMITVPPAPPEPEAAQLLDLSWLLCHGLVVEDTVDHGGRTAFRVSATRATGGAGGAAFLLFERMEVLVDAELGVGLRLTWYQDGKAAARRELRDVLVAGFPDAEFVPAAAPGGRSYRGGGGPLGDSALPSAVKAVAGAAVALVGGAALFAGLLGRKPSEPGPEARPEPAAEPAPEPAPEPGSRTEPSAEA